MAGAYWTLISLYNKPACQILRWWQLITQQINKCPYPRCFKLYGFPSTLSCYHTKGYIYKRYINCITFSFLFWITIDQLLPVGHPPLDLLHSPGHDAHQLRAIFCDDDIIFNPDSPKPLYSLMLSTAHPTTYQSWWLCTLPSGGGESSCPLQTLTSHQKLQVGSSFQSQCYPIGAVQGGDSSTVHWPQVVRHLVHIPDLVHPVPLLHLLCGDVPNDDGVVFSQARQNGPASCNINGSKEVRLQNSKAPMEIRLLAKDWSHITGVTLAHSLISSSLQEDWQTQMEHLGMGSSSASHTHRSSFCFLQTAELEPWGYLDPWRSNHREDLLQPFYFLK